MHHNINISQYNPLAGCSYIKLPKELNHQEKVWLIFKILRTMNALNGNTSQILTSCRPHSKKNCKSWQWFCKKVDFKDISFPVKIRGIHKFGKENSVFISALIMKIGKISNLCFKKKIVKRHMLIYYW